MAPAAAHVNTCNHFFYPVTSEVARFCSPHTKCPRKDPRPLVSISRRCAGRPHAVLPPISLEIYPTPARALGVAQKCTFDPHPLLILLILLIRDRFPSPAMCRAGARFIVPVAPKGRKVHSKGRYGKSAGDCRRLRAPCASIRDYGAGGGPGPGQAGIGHDTPRQRH